MNFNLGADNSVEFAQRVVSTNYYGTKNMIKSMIPVMQPSAAGARIVNVSSRLGRLNGRRNVSIYFLPSLFLWFCNITLGNISRSEAMINISRSKQKSISLYTVFLFV